MAKKPTKEETKQRKDERLSANIDRGRKKIVIKGKEPQTEEYINPESETTNETTEDK